MTTEQPSGRRALPHLLVGLTVLLVLALQGPVADAAQTDDPDVRGDPVDVAGATRPATAPLLAAGQSRDVLPLGSPRWYALDVPSGTTAEVVVAPSTPSSVSRTAVVRAGLHRREPAGLLRCATDELPGADAPSVDGSEGGGAPEQEQAVSAPPAAELRLSADTTPQGGRFCRGGRFLLALEVVVQGSEADDPGIDVIVDVVLREADPPRPTPEQLRRGVVAASPARTPTDRPQPRASTSLVVLVALAGGGLAGSMVARSGRR